MSANLPKRNGTLVEKRNSYPLLWPAAIIAAVVAVDQATKLWAIDILADRSSVDILGSFLRFSIVYNLGGAMGTSLGTPRYYLIVGLIILPFVLYYIYAHRFDRPIGLPLSFIAGGAIGNLIDRIRLGHVIDFIDIDFFDISIGSYKLSRWWTFNVADAAIFCSMIYLVIYLAWIRPRRRHAAVANSEVVVTQSDGAESDTANRES